MRVEPAMGSAPVLRNIACSASSRMGVPGLLAMPTANAPPRLAQARQSERRGATRSYCDQRIVGADLVMACELSSASGLVLRAFHGPDHGLLAASDQQQKSLPRPAECGHQFCAVLDGQSA